MLHCLVFKEQLCLLKFAFVWKALLQATHLLYRISFRLSRTFLFFFFVWVIRSSKALPIKEHFLARPVSRGDLYYITGWWCICQHLFLKNCKVFLSSCSKIKTHRLLDASYWLLVAAQRFELRTLRVWTACSSQLSYAAINGGQGWIRTIVIRRWQIYSLFPLTTRAPTRYNGDPGGTRTLDPLIRSQIL